MSSPLILRQPLPDTSTVAMPLPAFFIAIFVMYWSVPIAVLVQKIKIWDFSKQRNDAVGWATFLKDFFRIKLYQATDRGIYRGGKCFYLANHRSWTDFYFDVYVTEGRAIMLSRMAVFLAFPVILSAVCTINYVVLFRRDRVRDYEAFNRWLDQKLASITVPGMIVYPEGHRSTRSKSLPLKRGMLKYAFLRKRVCQLVITANKEKVLSEKKLTTHFNQRLMVGFSDPIDPAQFGTFDEFFAHVEKTWEDLWVKVYSADPTALPVFDPEPIAGNHALTGKILQIPLSLCSISLLLATIYYCWRGAVRLVGRLPEGISAMAVTFVVAFTIMSLLEAFASPKPKVPVRSAAQPAAVNGAAATSQAANAN